MPIERTRCLILLALAALVCTQLGCGNDHGSPKAVHSAAREAIDNKDYPRFFALVAPDEVEITAKQMVRQAILKSKEVDRTQAQMEALKQAMKNIPSGAAGFQKSVLEKLEQTQKMLEAMQTVLEKHGMTQDELRKPGANADVMVAEISDKAQFVGEMIATLAKSAEAIGIRAVNPPQLGALDNVEVEGESATGTMKVAEEEVKVHFTKVDGKWFIKTAPPSPF